ncbi:MAG: VOC family protein [Myxococcota bacterium]|nr:VOC family protein [Myxococcota bacterium]
MIAGARYVHTDLIAHDWRRLAGFYERVFGCERVPPERDYRGPDLDAGTGIPGGHLTGVHLRLPGCGAEGPTLELFQYDEPEPAGSRAVNRPGFTHIAFQVDDVESARAEVLSEGGSAVGRVVELEPEPGSRVCWCYVTDPEGNVIELQSWS